MGIYAGLGVAQAFAMFLMGSAFAILTFFASQTLHRGAIRRVMTAPMSFFETTVSLLIGLKCFLLCLTL